MKTQSNLLSALITEAMESKTLFEINEAMFNGWEGFEKNTATVDEVIQSGIRHRNALNAIQSMLDYLEESDIDQLIDLEDLGIIH